MKPTKMEETFNFSKKADPFETTTNKYHFIQTQLAPITNMITSTLCVCAVFSDIIIIVTILSLKKLHSPSNIYLMRLTLFNCLYFLIAGPFFILFEHTPLSSYYNSKYLCTLLQAERTCLSFCFLFTFGLCFQWLVSSNSQLGDKFSRILKYLPYVLYSLGTTKFLAAMGLCFTEYSHASAVIHDIIYFATFIFCSIVNVVDFKCGLQVKDLSGISSNIIVFCWLPIYIHKYLYKISVKIGDDNLAKIVLEQGKFLFEWPSYASALTIFVIFSIEINLLQEIRKIQVCRRSKQSYHFANQLEEEETMQENDDHQFGYQINKRIQFYI